MVEEMPAMGPVHGRLSGKKAWRQSLNLAAISAGKVESSLGPMGAYKMVTFNRGPERVIKVTKDAVEVLNELEVQYPAVKTLAESARLHRQDVGDGVSTFVIIMSSLLNGADSLLDKKTHPNVIVNGYYEAAKEASRVFNAATLPEKATDDEVLQMVDCGRDVLTPGIRAALKEAARRAERQGGVDLKRVRVVSKSGGAVADSKLVRGVVVRKERAIITMPRELLDSRIAVVNNPLDIKPLELRMKGKAAFNVKLEITGEGQMQRFREEEARMNSELVTAVRAAGARLVVCRSKITAGVAQQMAKEGIMGFSMIGQEDMDAICEATGAIAVGDVKDLGVADLGKVERIWTEKIENVDYFFVEAAKGSTLLLRGSSIEEIAELERVVMNAVRLMGSIRKDARAAWGGGATFMRAATRLREYALEFSGKEQMAIEKFADALEEVPAALIRNFGLNYATVLPQIRSAHANKQYSVGIGPTGCTDMRGEGGVRDLVLANKLLLSRAYEVSRLLLRIDEYFFVKELALVHKKG